MAYLPTVNDTNLDRRSNLESATNIVDSLSKRMKLTSTNSFLTKATVDNDKQNKSLSTVGSSDKTSDILVKLYDFIVKDYNQNDLKRKIDDTEQEIYDDNAQERELALLQTIPQLMNGAEKEDKEGLFARLWRYFKYFNFGKMVYNNWDKVSKLLGLEKLTESIKNLANEFGITNIISDIKKTIDDILENFSLGKPSKIVAGEGDVEKIMATIRSRESSGNYTKRTTLGGTASGAYQFTDATWQSVSKKIPGASQYSSAWQAPPEIQDAVARKYVQDILQESGGDVGAVARKWYTGNIQGKMSPEALAKNKGFTSERYEEEFMKSLSTQGFKTNKPASTTENKDKLDEIPSETKQKKNTETPSIVPVNSPVEMAFPVTSPVPKKTEEKKESLVTRVPKRPDVPLKTTSASNVTGNNPLDVANKFLRKDEKTDAFELNSFISQNFGKFDVTKTPWCAAFANSVLSAAGYKGTGNASASSFLTLPGIVYDKLTGQGNVQDAKPGDVAVFERTGGHHVGFVQSVDMTGITIVGGNQSDKDSGGQVSVSKRSFDGLLGIRRPGTYGAPTLLSETRPSSRSTQTQQQKPKSLMEIAADAYKSHVDLMNQFFSPEGIKSLEEGLEKFMQNIPKKEKYIPDIGSMVQQNNYVMNNVQEQRLILQNSSPTQSDLPPILQQFLNEHQ